MSFRFEDERALKVRKKPIVVEAYQTHAPAVIPTPEGDMLANEGDWIIRGVAGELCLCGPGVFDKTYEIARIISDGGGWHGH